MRRTGYYLVIALLVGIFTLPAGGFAWETEFHGYLESRGIFRDENGFQYGFADNENVVQWMQEMQLDLEVRPTYAAGQPMFRFEKAFFRYRGAYDAILDIRDEYDDIRKKSPDDFELGKDDIKLENDLRECFADFVGEDPYGATRANLRLGRQIVQWGDADLFNLMNVINPSDNRNKMFFSNPEDLAIPLWMARFDLKVPGVGIFENFNAQILGIPDIRPNITAPLDGKYNAPYATFFKGFAPLRVVEDVKSSSLDHSEFGARLGTSILTTAIYFYYFEGYQDAAAYDSSSVNLTNLTITARHPKQRAMGASFSRFIETGNFILRGEGSLTKDSTVGDGEDIKGYSFYDFYQALLGVDKTLSNMPIGTDSALTTSFQVYYNKIKDYNENPLFGRTAPEDDFRATILLTTDYIHGTLTPTFAAIYDFEGSWLTNASLNWCPDGHWYVNLAQISFWGDPRSNSAYAGLIKAASEVALKIGWRW